MIYIRTCAYNAEKTLQRAVDSVLNQTYQDFDIVLVDDCSKDRTRDWVQDYVNRYPRRIQTFYLDQNLGSPAKTRNWALNSGFIDGKYVVFLDGDDSIEPQYLERLHTLIEETGADVAVCAYDRGDSACRVLGT